MPLGPPEYYALGSNINCKSCHGGRGIFKLSAQKKTLNLARGGAPAPPVSRVGGWGGWACIAGEDSSGGVQRM